MKPPIPHNEMLRLECLRSYNVLDTSHTDKTFGDITRLLSTICECPISAISLVDEHRQWFKSQEGLGSCQETPRSFSFCAHTILERDIMEIPDTLGDVRFQDNPLVQKSPHIRFYAGCPLMNSEGIVLGSLCVIDAKPRKLTTAQRDLLTTLARQVMAQFELQRQMGLLKEAHEEARLNEAEAIKNMCMSLAFADQLSHEIRTPLNGIMGIGYLLGRTNLLPEQKEYVMNLNKSAEHLRTVINNVLHLSKVGSGSLVLENVVVNPYKAAEDAVVLCNAGGSQVDVLVELTPDGKIQAEGEEMWEGTEEEK